MSISRRRFLGAAALSLVTTKFAVFQYNFGAYSAFKLLTGLATAAFIDW
jgi:hypothetical protein